MDAATQAAMDTAYWTEWLVWATVFLGVATLVLGAAAIWGDSIKARWLRPRLTVGLLSTQGMDEVSARYYRLRVTNLANTMATSVQVFLLRVDEVVSGAPSERWASEIPLIWMNESTRDKVPTLGRDAPEICDLFCVSQESLRITTRSVPHSLGRIMNWPVGKPVHLILTVEARSEAARSRPARIDVNWGGGWLPGDAEMAKTLSVRLLS
jgi:hypothetical protein